MKPEKKTISPLEKKLLQIAEKKISLSEKDAGKFHALQQEALTVFKELGLPHKKLEKWRNTDLSDWYQKSFNPATEKEKFTKEVNDIFECTVQGFDSNVVSILNGHYYSSQESGLQTFDNGVIIGSLANAKEEYPEYFEKYYSSIAKVETNGMTAINAALAEDGVFVYVPDNV